MFGRGPALGGLFHDREYRASLMGISEGEFLRRFPNTFYRLKDLPPVGKPEQHWYVNDYQQSIRTDGRTGIGWVAVFENDRLIEFEYVKT